MQMMMAVAMLQSNGRLRTGNDGSTVDVKTCCVLYNSTRTCSLSCTAQVCLGGAQVSPGHVAGTDTYQIEPEIYSMRDTITDFCQFSSRAVDIRENGSYPTLTLGQSSSIRFADEQLRTSL